MVAEGFKEMLWMKKFLNELGHDQDDYMVNYDNQSAIQLAKNPMFHSRSKHIDIHYHWIREVLDEKKLKLEKIHTNFNWYDMMTKTIPTEKVEDCCQGAGIVVHTNYVGRRRFVGNSSIIKVGSNSSKHANSNT